MKRLIAAALAVTAIAGSANAAITAHTGAFLTTVTNTNGFEGMPFTDAWNGPYTEDGITAEYIGAIFASGKGIWDFYQHSEGSQGWYENGGGDGYTKITLANGADFTAIQFAVGNGLGSPQAFSYRLLNNGVVLQHGQGGTSPGSTMATFGFSGAVFDEFDIQVNYYGGDFQASGAYDIGSYDAFRIGTYSGDVFSTDSGHGVPEPASWALMLLGFGGLGAVLRRQRARVAMA